MGNYCSVCGKTAEIGNYCQRCYNRRFPSCSYCRKDFRSYEATVGGVCKFPCYSQMTGKCCECDSPVDNTLNGSYCRNCYDSMYPPPRILHMRDGDREGTLYLRNDQLYQLQPLAYAFARGLEDGGQGNRFLMNQ